MIYLKHKDGKVYYVHNLPFHEKHGLGKTREELELEGILIDSIPEPFVQDGRQEVMYVNPTTKEIYYEYIDIPKTPEQIQQDNMESVQKQLFETQTELLLSKSETERLGEQLFILQTNLTEKGVM